MSGALETSFPTLFCPKCFSYLGLSLVCPCGYSRQGEAKKLDVEQPIWQGKLPGAARSHAVLIGDEIFFAWRKRQGGPGGVAAFNCNTGLRRELITTNYAVENLTHSGSLLIIPTHGLLADDPSELICVDLNNDGCTKVNKTSGGISTTPLIINNRAYVASGDGHIEVLDLVTLDLLKRNWPATLNDGKNNERGKIWLTQFKNVVLAACESGRVYALDVYTGKQIWRKPIDVGDRITSQGVLVDSNLYFGVQGGKICSLDLIAYRVKFFDHSLTLIIANLINQGNMLFAGGHNHEMHALSLPGGQLAWDKPVKFKHSISNTPALQDGLLMVCANGGEVCAIEADTGKVGWRFFLDGSGVSMSDPFFRDGKVYLGTESGDVFAFPWHLGHYAWAAAWLEKRDQFEDAAALYAVLGDMERISSEKRGQYYEKAITLWRNASRWDLAAYFREAVLDEKADQIALEYENGGKSFYRKDPILSANLLRKAISWYEEADHLEGVTRCQNMLMKVSQAFISIQCTLPEEWTAEEEQEVVFDLQNKGSVPVNNIRVLISGTSIKEHQWKSPYRSNLPPGENTLIQSMITPLTSGKLNVDVHYTDENGLPLKTNKKFPMTVRPSSTSIEVDGDVGNLTLSEEMLKGKVKIRGSAGGINIKVAHAFRWPDPMPGFKTDNHTILCCKAVSNTDVKVPDGHSAIFKADGKMIGIYGPGIYKRNGIDALRGSLMRIKPNPSWEIIQFYNDGIRLAFRIGPYPNIEKIQVGIELGVTISLLGDHVMGLWQKIAKGCESIDGETLHDWITPEIDRVTRRWVHTLKGDDLLDLILFQDMFAPNLENELASMMREHGMLLVGHPWVLRPIVAAG